MIKASLCGLLFLSATTIIQCMETNNSTIGYIDKLMIQRLSTLYKTCNIQNSIRTYKFSADTPFRIERIVNRQDKSALSNAVFRMTDEHEVIFNSANPLNEKQNLLDHCTEWQQSQTSPDSIELTSSFYDKDALLTTLDTLNKK